MIKIDFHAATHGHFLEYVTNIYIMGTNPGYSSPFTPNVGSAHNTDDIYQANKVVRCGHFTKVSGGHYADPKYIDHVFNPTDQIIKIDIQQSNDKAYIIALTNLLYRAGTSLQDNLLNSFPEHIRNDRIAFRNDFFSKINERELYGNLFPQIPDSVDCTFNFPFMCFYSFVEFAKKLKELADWLGREFVYKPELYLLWAEFISRNQGYTSFNKCSKIIENILGNINSSIEGCTELEEAWINYNIVKVTGNYLPILFNNVQYPTSTQDIYKEL